MTRRVYGLAIAMTLQRSQDCTGAQRMAERTCFEVLEIQIDLLKCPSVGRLCFGSLSPTQMQNGDGKERIVLTAITACEMRMATSGTIDIP